MSLPLNILDLAINEEPAGGDVNKRLEKGAEMVEDFARHSSLSALDALLALRPAGAAPDATPASADPDTAARAGHIAEEVTQQATMLQEEVERFLSTTPKP